MRASISWASSIKALPDRHAVAEALIELLGDALDPLGRRVEGVNHRARGRLGAVGGDYTGILQRVALLLQAADLARGFRQFVGHNKRRHHRETCVADLAEFLAQFLDPPVEILGKRKQMLLLPVLAGK